MEAVETKASTRQPDRPGPLFKKRSNKAKSTFRKRVVTPPPGDSDSDSADYSSSDDGNGQRVKRRKIALPVGASSGQGVKPSEAIEASVHAAERSANIDSTNDATKQSNWYDENTSDALSSRNLLGTTRARSAAEVDGNGTYKGAANYQSFIQKNPDAPTRQVGPVKAPTNIRTITVTDFAPDVCKDYKQTGFCGFGDSCKFLHAREDYKQGWELDKDWEIGTKGKKFGGQTVASANRSKAGQGEGDDDDDDDLLEHIPFACIICKKPYTNPIITKCGHYFCEACALQRYRRNPSCAACGAGTGGVFNGAKNLRKLLEKKRERARRRKERDKEEGLDVSEDDEVDEDDGDDGDEDDGDDGDEDDGDEGKRRRMPT